MLRGINRAEVIPKLNSAVDTVVPSIQTFTGLIRVVWEEISPGRDGTREATTLALLEERRQSSSQSSLMSAATSPSVPKHIDITKRSLPLPSLRTRKIRHPVEVLEAIREVKEDAFRKFTESVDVAMRLGIDPRRGDQQVRGSVVLPHGTGKQLTLCVFAAEDHVALARNSGADLIGDDDTLAKIHEGEIAFDKCLATTDMLPKLTKVARVLGPKGLMPNPKLGTLVESQKLAAAIREMKGGRVEFRTDKSGNVHAGIGKVNFTAEQLYENLGSFAFAILNARPKGLKGSGISGYLLSVHLSSTMGSGVPITIPSVVTASQKSKRS